MPAPQRTRRVAPIKGLQTDLPADLIDQGHSPRAINVRFRFGEVRSAPGRSIVAGPAAGEDALYIGRFPQPDGVTWAVLLTETGLFRWGASAPGDFRQWHRVNGTALTGTQRFGVATGEDKFFFCRTGNPIQRWPTGSGTPQASNYGTIVASSGTIPTAARAICYFNNRLNLGWTTEAGTEYGNRVRYSINGDHTNWGGTGSGFLDLDEAGAEPIQRLEVLSGRMVAYRQHSITDFIPTGTTSPVYATETRVNGRGCRAPHTIASNGQVHFFLGDDANVYAWDGVRMTAIGDAILSDLQGLVYPSQMADYFGIVSTQRQEYWLVLAGGVVFIYDYARDAWTRDSFPDITALGEVDDTRDVSIWSTMTTTWATEPHTWDILGGTSSAALWAGRSNGATFMVDETVAYDYFAVGSIMEAYCETPDTYLGQPPPPNPAIPGGDPMQQSCLQRMLISYEYTGAQPFEVGVSTDRGQTWTTRSVTPSTSGFSLVDFNVTGHVWRARFREADATGTFRWRSYLYEVLDAGPYTG